MSLLNKGTYRDSEGFVHKYASKSKKTFKYMVTVFEKNRSNPMTAYFNNADDAKHFASYYRTTKAKQSGYKVETKKVDA